MDPPPKPKKNPEEVEVFYILPDKEIKLIGSLNIFYGEGYERKFAIRSLRKKASSLGADFILIDLVKKKNVKWRVNQGEQGGYSYFNKSTKIISKMYQYLE